ncbi:MAG: GNAT family N-acetyltransferase [Candidatus Saccharimonadales bacterium]
MQSVAFERPDIDEVNLELTAYLQGIALRGWAKTLPNRSDQELRHQFNPDKHEHLARVQKIYKEFAELNGLVLARTTAPDGSSDPIAFALARDDVSGNAAERLYKRHFRPEKVYAILRHVCVDAPYQQAGVGKQLVGEALRPFRDEQVPTAYIFEENLVALKAFQRLGFEKSSSPQEPKILDDYFGTENPAVAQYRFAAGSVEAVRNLAAA